jgi:transposase-like protein
MKVETKERKKAMAGFRQISSEQQRRQQLHEIIQSGTHALNRLSLELGQQLAEFILYSEREELAGPDYQPRKEGLYKWASESGSVYVGGQKVAVEKPRLRGNDKEFSLKSYRAMKEKEGFSEELLGKSLAGLSARRYRQTLVNAAEAFGVSPSAVSERLVEATSQKLKQFRERRLEDFHPFAVFIDTVHRGGVAFVVALGLDIQGQKLVLGFWEGATENAEVAEMLLTDLEQRGLKLSAKVLFIIDGGKGLAKTLKSRYGRKLVLQRCTIHKDRNLQAHLPKRHRAEAHRRFRIALEQNDYKEAEKLLRELEQWLRAINESAADSLLEAFHELLTLHRLKVPALLRRTLHSTNPIESLFSRVRSCEKNLKRYRNSQMSQRWLATVLLYAEKTFRTVKGIDQIQAVLENIEKEQQSITAN